MRACGIVAEYNPFHNGHAYQIEQVRKQLRPDVVIAVMSGNFLQRGEPAFLDKWTRTEMALAGGVDLVVELPVQFSTQPADYFAKGAIQILGDLNIDCLSFGVEEGLGEEFLQAARWMVENDALISHEMTKRGASDVPYAKRMEEVLSQLAPNFPLHLNSPNNQLGFAYAKEIVKQDLVDQIEIAPLIRKGTGYHEPSIKDGAHIASATAIRNALQKGEDVQAYLPKKAFDSMRGKLEQAMTWDDYFDLLKYQLIVSSTRQLHDIYQMTEGLEYRLKDQIIEATSFEDFINRIKTKRYTRTRLQRLLTYVLLSFSKEEMEKSLDKRPAIRVLGFNKKGQAYLSEQKHALHTPLVSNVNQKTKEWLNFDILAGEIYALGHENIPNQDFKRHPIKFD
ncbi:MAG TPA: nucleotidyltransferase [Atopostipes sp.]|nr:nucleotidyltransferase [Atopostipes sp.]